MMKICTHERHPIPRPYGRAMGCHSWVIQKYMTAIYGERTATECGGTDDCNRSWVVCNTVRTHGIGGNTCCLRQSIACHYGCAESLWNGLGSSSLQFPSSLCSCCMNKKHLMFPEIDAIQTRIFTTPTLKDSSCDCFTQFAGIWSIICSRPW